MSGTNEATPTIEQIQDNPFLAENLTDEQMEALMSGAGADGPVGDTNGSDTPNAAGTQGNEPGKQVDPSPAGTVTDPAATAADSQQEKVIQAPDGKHTIPYSVLTAERERASRAEQMLQAQAEEIARLRAGGESVATGDGKDASAVLSDADMASLEQDLPDVAKALKAQAATINQLNGAVNTLQREMAVKQHAEVAQVQDEIEAAILATPELKSWRDAAFAAETPDPLMWNRAADLDAMLRNDPAWRDRPVAERFAHVAKSVKLHYGDTTQPQDTNASLHNKAAAALAAASANGTKVPTSMGAIPGGTMPPVDEAAALDSKSGVELMDDFSKLTPDQIEAKLARAGF